MWKGLLFNIVRDFIIDEIDELLLIIDFEIGSGKVFLGFLLFFQDLNSLWEVFDYVLQNVRILHISTRLAKHFCFINNFLLGRNKNGWILIVVWGTVRSFDSGYKFRRMKPRVWEAVWTTVFDQNGCLMGFRDEFVSDFDWRGGNSHY